MNLLECQKRVDEVLQPMRVALGLHRWEICIVYDHLCGEAIGQCEIDVEHGHATITIDASQHEDLNELDRTLRHELLHLVHGQFEVYRKSAAQHIDGAAWNAIDVSFRDCCEKLVNNLEYMLDRLAFTPKRLVREGRKRLGE